MSTVTFAASELGSKEELARDSGTIRSLNLKGYSSSKVLHMHKVRRLERGRIKRLMLHLHTDTK